MCECVSHSAVMRVGVVVIRPTAARASALILTPANFGACSVSADALRLGVCAQNKRVTPPGASRLMRAATPNSAGLLPYTATSAPYTRCSAAGARPASGVSSIRVSVYWT